MDAVDRALALEPRHVRALLQKASILEGKGRARDAAVTYRHALQSIPPGIDFPPALQSLLRHARATVDANNRELEAFLEKRMQDLRARHRDTPLKRFDQCVAVLLQKERVFRQQPTFLYFPQLPAIEFPERGDFPWLDAIEAQSDAIRDEFLNVLADAQGEFEPYVSFREGVPVDQWRELNHSRRWSVYYLWHEGVAMARHLARCPRTVAALGEWPRWDAKGPTVLFSVLDAKTRIPPHVGVYNARLTVHLPLIIPAGCGLRVGAERREWTPGKAVVFDDAIEHEAWNDSDVPRAVLIFDTWNPLLSQAEREMVRALVASVDEYYANP
jgi:aspartyl/asparaginyl beta-hydroxylase (cupin superfamily)